MATRDGGGEGTDSYDGTNTTGFVSPAGDALEGVVDLSAVLDLRRPHRYAVRAAGDLPERGIQHGDVLIADTDRPPAAGRVCVAFVHGSSVIATLVRRDGGAWWLRFARRAAVPVDGDVEVWAIVCALVRTRV